MSAGHGTRLRPFSDTIAKPFIPLFGVPFVQYVIESIRRYQAKQVVCNVCHLMEDARARFDRLSWNGIRHRISFERNGILGGAGGIRQMIEQVEGDRFILANADRIMDVPFDRLTEQHDHLRKTYGVEMTLLIFKRHPFKTPYREVSTGDDLVTQFGQVLPGKPFYAGIGVFEKSAFSHLSVGKRAELLEDVFLGAVEKRKVGYLEYSGIWYDVDSPQLWADVHWAMMKDYHSGEMPLWLRQELKKNVEMISKDGWVGKGKVVSTNGWKEPYFWDGDVKAIPQAFGPRAIFYGSNSGDKNLKHAIAIDRLASEIL